MSIETNHIPQHILDLADLRYQITDVSERVRPLRLDIERHVKEHAELMAKGDIDGALLALGRARMLERHIAEDVAELPGLEARYREALDRGIRA